MLRALRASIFQFPDTAFVRIITCWPLIKKGSSRHWVDMVQYTIEADTFYFTVPPQIHVKEEADRLSVP